MSDSIDVPAQHQPGPTADVLSGSGDGQPVPSSCGQGGAKEASAPQAPLSGDYGQGAVEQDPVPSACGQGTAQEPVASGCGQAQEKDAAVSTCGAGVRYLDEDEMEVWRAFLAASTTVTTRLNHELEAGAGISMHEYEILVRLSEAPRRTLRMSTLAQNVSHSRSRLTHTVSRLEQAGYVERTVCSMDKRGVNCVLTDAGQTFLRAAAPMHLDGVRRHVIDRLERSQLAELTVLLRALVEPETPDEPGSCGA